MPPILTIASQVQCMHGGTVLLTTSNSSLLVDENPALLETDIHSVVGCPFIVATVPMPCLMVQWQAASTTLAVNGAGVLLETSIGECLNAAGAPQGIAVIAGGASQMEAV